MKTFLSTLLTILLLNFCAFAQNQNAVQKNEQTMLLTGVVYDINGAVIVNGIEIVAYGSQGKKYETVTNDDGIYKLQLPLTIYSIEVSAPGFCRQQVEHFRVVNSTYGKISLDFVLEVAPNGQRHCKHEFEIEKKPKRKARKKPDLILE